MCWEGNTNQSFFREGTCTNSSLGISPPPTPVKLCILVELYTLHTNIPPTTPLDRLIHRCSATPFSLSPWNILLNAALSTNVACQEQVFLDDNILWKLWCQLCQPVCCVCFAWLWHVLFPKLLQSWFPLWLSSYMLISERCINLQGVFCSPPMYSSEDDWK